MRRIENDCVGCDYCVNCPKKRNYVVYSCDACGDDLDEGESLYELGRCEVCLKCFATERAKNLVADLWGDGEFMDLLNDWASIYKVEEDEE